MTYKELLARYTKKHGKLHTSKNLDKSLWLAWSMGLERGFTDLGTYNPKSLLPSGAKSDHALGPPCFAFDLGRKNRFFFKGFQYLTARRLFKLYVAEHQALSINYVILGKKIWSREKGFHDYSDSDGSHAFHIHVSGVHD